MLDSRDSGRNCRVVEEYLISRLELASDKAFLPQTPRSEVGIGTRALGTRPGATQSCRATESS